MDLITIISFLIAVALAAIHLISKKPHMLEEIPPRHWFSFAGGVSVAYVFLHILPELQAQREAVLQEMEGMLEWLEYPVYLMALAGLVVFYGLERLAKTSRAKKGDRDQGGDWDFWVHIGAFSLNYALIGYLLLHLEAEMHLVELLFFSVAIAFHFFIIDDSLREHHQELYKRLGRWFLAGGVLLGWWVGLVAPLPDWVTGLIFAFISGAIILNVLKEELPEDRQSRFGAFLAGTSLYSILLLL